MADLRTFVSQTLIDVAGAIRDAQEATRGVGAIINPANVRLEGRAQTEARRGVEDVRFDVAVTAEDVKGKKGGFQVSILSIGASKTAANANATRVSFSIPVCWPVGDESAK
jgi:hypothetical protein